MKKQVINCVFLLLFCFTNINVFAQQKSNESNTTSMFLEILLHAQILPIILFLIFIATAVLVCMELLLQQ